MWVSINGRWHFVVWTDPDYISAKGEMLHKTRCGLLKIRLTYHLENLSAHVICGRCRNLLAKDALRDALAAFEEKDAIAAYDYETEGLGGT